MSVLSVRSVQKKFGALNVINSISLDLHPGSVTAIVGDNGAGKSTFLKLLAGAVQPDSGEILLGGVALNRLSSQQRRAVGIEMVYQDLALAPNHDIVTNLFLGREISRWGLLRRAEMRTRATQILSEIDTNLPELSVSVGILSGGQQQTVAIARALLFNPKIILLDEPTASLAAREIDRVIDIIKQQRALNRCVVLVSHRLNDVFAVADRIIVLKHGAVYSDSSTSAVTLTEVVKQIVS